MSTCHEVVVARQCGIRVVGMSLISNIANSTANPSHAEVTEAALEASKRACKFVEALVMAIDASFSVFTEMTSESSLWIDVCESLYLSAILLNCVYIDENVF
uniref:purine-nucleoside phosphorylase n=1 Tax=Ascaris lumbricoides TaxID=6252 RepID=A0A0M3IQF0_ASCLU